MKNHAPILITLLLAAALPVTGCAKHPGAAPARVAQLDQQKVEPPAAPTIPTTPPVREAAMTPAIPANPCGEMKAALAQATFDQHTGLSETQQRMDRDIDMQVSAKKSSGADVSLAVDQKLDTATTDFAEKLRMLTVATAETWNNAKHDTELALQNVSDAFTEVMNSPQRK